MGQQYGFLLRNNLEGLHLFEIKGDQGRLRPRAQWQARIDGVEGFAGYMTSVHEYAYNRVIIGEAIESMRRLEAASYELVVAVDIVEHFAQADGLAFLAECRCVAGRYLLAATPSEFIALEIDANPLENHRSVWSEQDLAAIGFNDFLHVPGSVIAAWKL